VMEPIDLGAKRFANVDIPHDCILTLYCANHHNTTRENPMTSSHGIIRSNGTRRPRRSAITLENAPPGSSSPTKDQEVGGDLVRRGRDPADDYRDGG
jgi:hypothetical protein